MKLEEERALVEEAKRNNQSFVKLYDYYYPKILGYAFRRTLDSHLAKDITAETFLKAYARIERFQWRGVSFSSWLFKIATNEMNMLYRKRKYSPASLADIKGTAFNGLTGEINIEEEKSELERQLQASRDFIGVQQKLLLLPVRYQEVIALRFFEEKSLKEIAEILNSKEGTVKSLLSRGVQKLKKLVTQ